MIAILMLGIWVIGMGVVLAYLSIQWWWERRRARRTAILGPGLSRANVRRLK